MPYSVKRDGKQYRVTDPATGQPAINTRTGKPIDGGGHDTAGKAERQAGHVAASEAQRSRAGSTRQRMKRRGRF